MSLTQLKNNILHLLAKINWTSSIAAGAVCISKLLQTATTSLAKYEGTTSLTKKQSIL